MPDQERHVTLDTDTIALGAAACGSLAVGAVAVGSLAINHLMLRSRVPD